MTSVFAVDPADTGEIRLHESLVDTEPRLAVGEHTRNLAPYVAAPPVLRRPEVTGEIPAYDPQTIGVVDEVPDYAAGGPIYSATAALFEEALTTPSGPSTPPPKPKPRPRADKTLADVPPTGRRRGKGRVPLPPLLVYLLGVASGWLANLITVLLMLDWFRSVTR